MHKSKRSETGINSVILHYRGFRQDHYSETALSEAHYSEGYLYLHAQCILYVAL
jgi:hypothetical protein